MSSSQYYSQKIWSMPDLLPDQRARASSAPTDAAHDNDAVWSDDLDRSMLVPGLSGRADWLKPVVRHMGAKGTPVLIATKGPAETGGRLTGRFALTKSLFRWAVPMPILISWDNPLFISGAPIAVSRDGTAQAISSMVAAAGREGARAVVLNEVSMSEDLIMTLERSNVPWSSTLTEERAALVCGQTFDDWFSGNFSRKRRKEYRRLHNRLCEQGAVTSVSYEAGEDPQPWIEQFLQLESSGWKGERGTAMVCDPAQRNAVTDALTNLAHKGDLMFWKLTLDERPIAMLFAIRCGETAGLGKIAYNEELSAYSPGVHLILDATRTLLATPGLKMVDSHAIPNHPMINNIWRDRIPFSNLMLGTPGTPLPLLKLMHRAELARRDLRQLAKTMYHRHLKRGTK
ncbi:MAG: GNAT family N-acetyltransferase [Alphaproteobacteria bacterium]|nr:GNAT family N-acetyltransferase [Alphaproteobacteria bacterium]